VTHTEQLRARVTETERRIASQVERLKRLNALGGAGFDQAAEALSRLSAIRDAYNKILSGPCPLTGERPRRVDPQSFV
jgi:hypothetical protein